MCSVSAEPPLLLVAIRTESPLVAAIEARGAFAVNVLSDGQAELAETFAGRGPGAHVFRTRDWWPLTGGAPPLLHGAAARFSATSQHHARRHAHARPRRRHPRGARRRHPPRLHPARLRRASRPPKGSPHEPRPPRHAARPRRPRRRQRRGADARRACPLARSPAPPLSARGSAPTSSGAGPTRRNCTTRTPRSPRSSVQHAEQAQVAERAALVEVDPGARDEVLHRRGGEDLAGLSRCRPGRRRPPGGAGRACRRAARTRRCGCRRAARARCRPAASAHRMRARRPVEARAHDPAGPPGSSALAAEAAEHRVEQRTPPTAAGRPRARSSAPGPV